MPRKPIPASVHISNWLRDGFVDRWDGQTKLWFLPFLRLKSHRDPVGFPFDTQWKDCHPDYWQGAQTDHAHAFGRGGSNDHDNLVSTSGTNNVLKGDRAADALGWTLQPRGDGTWDGGLRDFVAAVDADPAFARWGTGRQGGKPLLASPQPTWPRAANSQIRCLGLFHGAGLSLRPIDLAARPDTLKAAAGVCQFRAARRYVRAAPVRTSQGDPSCPQEKTFRFPEWCSPETARRFI